MIRLTLFNGGAIFLNALTVATVTANRYDSVIGCEVIIAGQFGRYAVKESADDVAMLVTKMLERIA